MEDHILNNVRLFCDIMGGLGGTGQPKEASNNERNGWSVPKNMTRWAGCLTFDIMGDICFSHSFEMLKKEDNRYILDVLPKGVQGFNIVSHTFALPLTNGATDYNIGRAHARPSQITSREAIVLEIKQ